MTTSPADVRPAVYRLSRSESEAAAAPPIRIVHLGLGNFVRAHQIWYTAHAADAAAWGVAAFTGRSATTAEALGPQDGLYTLVTRAADGDRFEVVAALGEVGGPADQARFRTLLAAEETAIVTLTVTEAAYRLGTDGHLSLGGAVQSDLDALHADPTAAVTTVPARLVAGLSARRAAGAGPLTVLSCDNLPHNGEVVRTVVRELAAELDPTLAAWIDEQVDFASSMVDRITPATTDHDRELVRAACGWDDAAPVTTEPYHEWVIAGRFRAGRPDWESVGARLVDDVAPYEQRKLTLLNGSHSLLAYAGSIRGHASIDEAVADPDCRAWVEQFWDEAEPHLTLQGPQIAEYRTALLERFGNPRIRHRLAQIAPDGSTKIPVRIVPTVRAERAAGRLPLGCATVLAAWVLHLRGLGAPFADADGEPYRQAAADDDLRTAVVAVLTRLDPALGADLDLVNSVLERAAMLTA